MRHFFHALAETFIAIGSICGLVSIFSSIVFFVIFILTRDTFYLALFGMLAVFSVIFYATSDWAADVLNNRRQDNAGGGKTMLENGKLLPCPFCGRTDMLEIDGEEDYENYGRLCLGVSCKLCHASKYLYPIPGATYEDILPDLIDYWNARRGEDNA